jgi:two-component system phosphate regulon sensor histidine kinase PhoR
MRARLFWKLGLTYFLLLLLVLLAVYFFSAGLLRRNFLEAGIQQLEFLARLAENDPPPLHDRKALEEWASSMARSGARVTVVASDGTVLADSAEDPERMENHRDRPEIRSALETGRGSAERYSETLNRRSLYLATRYFEDDGSPVVFRFAVPLARLNESIGDILQPIGSVSALVLLLGGALSLAFARRFTKRVERLKELSRRVAQGDFRPAPAERDGDELEELKQALNETAAQMETTIRALKEERDQSSAILESMSEGVAVVGPDQRVVFCNRAFRQSLLISAPWESCQGRPLVELTRLTDLLALVETVLAGNEPIQREISIGAPGARQFLAKAAPIGRGSPRGAVLVLLDITEARRLERVRRDFVANVSHELKTPLTAIRGFAETLLEGAIGDPENSRRFLGIIRDHSVRLGQLTDDLLKLSRIEAGKLDLELQPVEIPELIGSCLETTRLKAEPRRLALSVETSPDLPRVLGDRHLLQDVLQNLLDNAVQYTASGGSITLRASPFRDGAEVRIDVRDTGIGIPLSDQKRIFERFYRVDPARSRAVGGTGLGLAIAKHLAEAHGGRIEVESELGRGSVFSLYLPALPPSAEEGAPPIPEKVRSEG